MQPLVGRFLHQICHWLVRGQLNYIGSQQWMRMASYQWQRSIVLHTTIKHPCRTVTKLFFLICFDLFILDARNQFKFLEYARNHFNSQKTEKYTVFQGALGPVRRVNVWWEGSTNVYVTSSIKFEYAKNQVAPNKKKKKNKGNQISVKGIRQTLYHLPNHILFHPCDQAHP